MHIDAYELRHNARQMAVPEHLIDGIVRYLVDHIRSGDFLMSVFANDLHSAMQYGDPVSLHQLPQLSRFIYFHFPPKAWGSREAVQRWLMREPATSEGEGD